MSSKLTRFIMTFDGVLACIFLIVLTAILFIEVFTRYCLGISSALNAEIAGVLFIWFVYLAIAFVTGQRNHIVVDLASMIFPKKVLRYIDLFADMVFLVFCLILFWNGVRLVLSTFEFSLTLSMSGISMAIPYSIVPFCFGLMSLRLIAILAQDIASLRNATAPQGDDNA